MRLHLVVTVESVSELHRPRWEGNPTNAAQRQLHVGFDGLSGYEVHLILASEAATALFELMGAIIAADS
jgi:hypothetical protein